MSQCFPIYVCKLGIIRHTSTFVSTEIKSTRERYDYLNDDMFAKWINCISEGQTFSFAGYLIHH